MAAGHLVELLNTHAGQHPDNLVAVSGTLRLSSTDATAKAGVGPGIGYRASHREVRADFAAQSWEGQHLRAMLTGDEPMEFCRDHLAAHKVPDLLRSVELLPMTGSGSFRRRALVQVVDLEPTTT